MTLQLEYLNSFLNFSIAFISQFVYEMRMKKKSEIRLLDVGDVALARLELLITFKFE